MYIIPKLLTKFKVLKVNHEPHAESEWKLEYKGWGPFLCEDQLFETLESDEELVGKGIEAQIDLDCFLHSPKPTTKQEKYMSFEGSFIDATGVVLEEHIKYYDNEPYYYYLIDSIFPLNVKFSLEKENLKPGDWVKVIGEAYLILPRGCNIR